MSRVPGSGGAHPPVHPDVQEILLSEERIAIRVRELGETITRDYAGREIHLVGVLKGAVVFAADLMRRLDLPVRLDFIAVSSYGASSRSSGAVRLLKDLDENPAGRHLLLVEDIIDTGLTLQYLLATLQARGPASLRVCAFLDKPARRKVEINADYVGFQVPDQFIVGYGLDYAGRYRHLPYVGVLRPSVYGS